MGKYERKKSNEPEALENCSRQDFAIKKRLHHNLEFSLSLALMHSMNRNEVVRKIIVELKILMAKTCTNCNFHSKAI
jgi:hypothetical protein